eukprot:Hpha_TRINITY_DN14546_c0_g2::TRINITY_DN14546_c0_g2_i1::g.47188::m.47188
MVEVGRRPFTLPVVPEEEKAEETVEEKPECRICLGAEDEGEGKFIAPCLCDGTVKWVHEGCLDAWRERSMFYRNLTHCNNCHYKFKTEVNVDISLTSCAVRVFFKHAPLFLLLLFAVGGWDMWSWLYGEDLWSLTDSSDVPVNGTGTWFSSGGSPETPVWNWVAARLAVGSINVFSVLGIFSLFTVLAGVGGGNGGGGRPWWSGGGGGGGGGGGNGKGALQFIIFFLVVCGIIYTVVILWEAVHDLFKRQHTVAKRYKVRSLTEAERRKGARKG